MSAHRSVLYQNFGCKIDYTGGMKTDKNFKPNPLLGQHFISDNSVLNILSRTVEKDSTVIEIGAGTGRLTEVLSQNAKKVIATEIDKRFEKPLEELAKKHNNVEVLFGDALSGILDGVIKKESGKNVWIVSNLPYHITEPFINKIVRFPKIKMILMVGKKFGIQSQLKNPEDPNYSELSFVCNAFFNISKIAEVTKEAFWPVPGTDSIILKFSPKAQISVNQKLILSQKYGGMIKNVLMKVFDKNITKNEARRKVRAIGLPDEILNKSFSQLNNNEVKVLAKFLDSMEPLLSS